MSLILAAALPTLTGCGKTDMSNKAERNAIKSGNNNFDNKDFKSAIADYDEALKANPASEAARYNRAMAQLHLADADSATLKEARTTLNDRFTTSATMPTTSAMP